MCLAASSGLGRVGDDYDADGAANCLAARAGSANVGSDGLSATDIDNRVLHVAAGQRGTNALLE